MLTNVDDIDNPTDEFCDECDNGCGEIFTYYELDLIVAGRKVYGSLEWWSCFTKDSTGAFKCSVPIQSRLKNGRLLKDKRFGNIYVSFAAISEKPNDDDESSCESAVYRKYFTLLAIEDDFGYITRLEGGANSFEDEDCLGWSASEIERVVLDQISQ